MIRYRKPWDIEKGVAWATPFFMDKRWGPCMGRIIRNGRYNARVTWGLITLPGLFSADMSTGKAKTRDLLVP